MAISNRCILFVVSMTIALWCHSNVSANATIIQQISLEFDADGLVDDLRDSDRIEGATEADINAAIVASITGNGVQSDASIEPFGNFGISGSQSRTGGFEHQILISNDMITNTAGVLQQVTANFIIDGGTFILNTAPGVMLSYRLTIASGLIHSFTAISCSF